METKVKRKWNEDQSIIAGLVSYLERGLAALNHEFGKVGDKPERFRHTGESGIYLIRSQDKKLEIEVTFRVKRNKNTV